MNEENEYKAYRLDVKKRLNTPFYKQIIDLKKLEKAGQDFNLISAGIATPEERMEQLKLEFTVRFLKNLIISIELITVLLIFRLLRRDTVALSIN